MFFQKRKIKTTARSAFWPCGSCRLNCTNECILCESCNRWYYSNCEQLSSEDFEILQSLIVPYTCNQCFESKLDQASEYENGLSRMLQAMEFGDQYLKYSACRESRFLNQFDYYGKPPISAEFISHTIDRYAKDTMDKFNMNVQGVPASVTGNGNCLFNAVSLALSGYEYLADELRLRTSIEMIMHCDMYTSRPDFDDLLLVSPTFDESVQACCKNKSHTSVFAMIALSSVIGSPIKSLYPPVNGSHDRTPSILTKVFCKDEDRNRNPVNILWSRMGMKQNTWMANHFIPIIPTENGIISIEQFNPQVISTLRKRKSEFSDTNNHRCKLINITDIKTENPHVCQREEFVHYELDECISVNNYDVSSDEFVHYELDDFRSENRTASDESPMLSHEQSHINETDNKPTLPTPQTIKPLENGRWHTAEEIYKLTTQQETVEKNVPVGDKSNCFTLVDNTRNIELLDSKKKCDFYDDCGVWDFKKGNTVKTTYIAIHDALRHVELKNNQYCTKRREKGRVIWEPVSPQPAENEVVKLSRYYATHKTDPSFKKKVSYFVRKNDRTLGHKAVYEYQGIQPLNTRPHGNSKTVNKNCFIRTHPATMDKIKEKMETQKPRDIFLDLKRDNSMTNARDFEVIRNKKYKDSKKENRKGSSKTNIADQILDVLSMVNDHPYVQTGLHYKDKVPSIICYTPDQIKDLRHFLVNSKGQPVGIDRTFNLGSFYVTTMVYKNNRVVRKNTNDSPIFLGPILLHKDATYKTYKGFLEHIATELDTDIDSIELQPSEKMEFGTDDETALTKAISHVFPDATRYLCTKHLKDNVKHYLQNKVGVEKKQREPIMNSIFGTNGIVDADTTIDFEIRSSDLISDIQETFPKFAEYFDGLLKPRLQKHVFEPKRKSTSKALWTNNNAESLNNILKLSINWQPKDLKELVQKLHNVTDLHFMDYRSALHETGNYRLAETYKHYRINDALWRCKSEEEKIELFKKFLADSKRTTISKFIKSSDGQFKVVAKAKGTARKPGQRRRPRNERTMKR